eukprot:Sdes_comp16220_c0_seq1m5500
MDSCVGFEPTNLKTERINGQSVFNALSAPPKVLFNSFNQKYFEIQNILSTCLKFTENYAVAKDSPVNFPKQNENFTSILLGLQNKVDAKKILHSTTIENVGNFTLDSENLIKIHFSCGTILKMPLQGPIIEIILPELSKEAGCKSVFWGAHTTISVPQRYKHFIHSACDYRNWLLSTNQYKDEQDAFSNSKSNSSGCQNSKLPPISSAEKGPAKKSNHLQQSFVSDQLNKTREFLHRFSP